MVLYAEPERITLAYTRDDSPAVGYVVHIENVAVAPELVALYQQLDAAGRRQLPGLRNEEPLGVASGDVLKVAVRDTGHVHGPALLQGLVDGLYGRMSHAVATPAVLRLPG